MARTLLQVISSWIAHGCVQESVGPLGCRVMRASDFGGIQLIAPPHVCGFSTLVVDSK